MKNTSKKKRHTKKYRIGASIDWIRNYEGENIVKGYSKWFGVNLICAMRELRKKGVEIDDEQENKIRKIEEEKRIAKQKDKENRAKKKAEEQEEFSDYHFAFIAGYTSGGVPYGLTHEEMKCIEEKGK